MVRTSQEGEIELGDDIVFRQRHWILQRAGWALMAVFVLGGLLGLVGAGPLNQAKAGEEGMPLWVEYPRFGHLQAPMSLSVHLGEQAAVAGVARVWLDRAYLEELSIDGVTPEPERVELAADRVIFAFSVATPDQPTEVTFRLEPQKVGLVSGRIGLAQGGAQRYRQFIYP